MEKKSRIYIAGHLGLVGSAIHRKLRELGYENLLFRSEKDLNLMRQENVEGFFDQQRPEYVFLAAAKVGGVLANSTFPAEFIYNNLAIQTNIIHSAYLYKVKKLLFLGSSCIYPRECAQPMREQYLLSGYLEQTNEPYAVAKIAGIKMCQAYNRQYGTCFISVMPTNLYGQNDNFDLETSHVLPALIRKFCEAKMEGRKEVEIWGTGTPKREFLYVDDLADACVFLMNNYEDSEIVNIGVGKDLAIIDLARLIARVVGFEGTIKLDTGKPDGTPVKRLDVSKLTGLGWQAVTPVEEGIRRTYKWYLDNYASRQASPGK
ncbi:MAG: GDP-L-fucose synthase [Deltaproteobacteria bacterium]|nr:GDP-L-fucose synthase [Deltaproteobacteria bacterium]